MCFERKARIIALLVMTVALLVPLYFTREAMKTDMVKAISDAVAKERCEPFTVRSYDDKYIFCETSDGIYVKKWEEQ